MIVEGGCKWWQADMIGWRIFRDVTIKPHMWQPFPAVFFN